MRKTTHASLGLSIGVVISVYTGIGIFLTVITSVYFSLLADIDHEDGYLSQRVVPKIFRKQQKMYYLIITLISICLFYFVGNVVFFYVAILSICLVIGNHREFYHTLLIMIPIALVLYYVNISTSNITIGLMAYTSHLILDMFNPLGVMLFYPLSKKSYRFPITFDSRDIKTKIIESMLVIAFIYVAAITILRNSVILI